MVWCSISPTDPYIRRRSARGVGQLECSASSYPSAQSSPCKIIPFLLLAPGIRIAPLSRRRDSPHLFLSLHLITAVVQICCSYLYCPVLSKCCPCFTRRYCFGGLDSVCFLLLLSKCFPSSYLFWWAGIVSFLSYVQSCLISLSISIYGRFCFGGYLLR
jgi:hypothetical protein